VTNVTRDDRVTALHCASPAIAALYHTRLLQCPEPLTTGNLILCNQKQRLTVLARYLTVFSPEGRLYQVGEATRYILINGVYI
jgi:hypothetical protein